MTNIKDAIEAAVPVEDSDNHRNAPRPDQSCLYGLAGEVGRAAAATTEANACAVAANFIAYMSVAVGRGPYLQVGNTWHHARLFMMHVGRSGRGRKGDATGLVLRIHAALNDLDETFAPQVHRGGLSSREGLAFLIHDGYREGKTEVEAIEDKRLLVVESEFANILHQGKRDGNTLSPALRDCWDGVSIRPATKGSRLWASNPHVGLLGAVTPSELRDLMAQRELTNGFANRFGIFWAERERIIPFPRATPKPTVEAFAQRALEVLRFCGADRWADRDCIHIELSQEAKARYEVLYLGELNDGSAGERINALLERRAPMLLRVAMVLALCDLSTTIEAKHINAALAWVRYFTESVKFIFASAVEEEQVHATNAAAEQIFKFLAERGQATRMELSRDCFKGHASKDELDEAIDTLLTSTPPRIELEVIPRPKEKPGTATKIYRLAANCANSANREHPCGFAPHSAVREVSEVCEVSETGDAGELPRLRTVSTVRNTANRPESRANAHSTHNSHNSHGDSWKVGEEL